MKLAITYNGYNLKIGEDQHSIPIFNGKLKKEFWRNIWRLDTIENCECIIFKIKTKIPFFNLNFKMLVQFFHEDIKNVVVEYKEKMPHMLFTMNNKNYLIIFHRNNMVSYFLNDNQFATFEVNPIVIGGVKTYKLISDDGISTKLLIFLVSLTVIALHDSPEDVEFIISGGGFFKELKAFDNLWRPKIQ